MKLNKFTHILFNTVEKLIYSITLPIQAFFLKKSALIKKKTTDQNNFHSIYKTQFLDLFKRYKKIQKIKKNKKPDLIESYTIFTYIIFIMVVGLISLTTIISYQTFWRSLEKQISFKATSIAKSADSLVNTTDDKLNYIGNRLLSFNSHISTITKLLSKSYKNSASTDNIYFVDNTNKVIITPEGKLNKPLSPKQFYPIYKSLRDDAWKLKIGDTTSFINKSITQNILPIAMRVEDKDSKPIGILISEIPLKKIQEQISLEDNNNICYLLLSDNNDILARSNNLKQDFDHNIIKSKITQSTLEEFKLENCVFTNSIKSSKYSLTTLTGYHQTNCWKDLAFQLFITISQLLGVSLIFLVIIYIFRSKIISPFLNELISAKEGAESASITKSQFLSNINHELRTPMNGIIGMSQALIESKKLKQDELDQANIIYRSADSLLVILNDILNFSKIESKTIDIKRITYNIKDLVEDVADLMSASANYKGIEIVSNIDENIPQNLVCDVGRIKQILNNLINNAIKFTYYGHIEIEVKLKEVHNDQYLLNFNVRDSGIGIAEEKIQTLFKVFTQVDMSTTRKYGGTGLGLSICKELVELMGGTIGLESETGKGSNFYFNIPMRKSKENIEKYDYHAEQKSQIIGKNIITVENNEVVSKKINNILTSVQLQNQTITGDNIDKQFMYILSHAQDKDINAIIISHNISNKINSIKLAKKIKDHSKTRNIPIICLMSIHDKLEAGNNSLDIFDCVVNKPVKDTKLISALLLALKAKYQETSQDKQQKQKTQIAKNTDNNLPQLKILICEDNEINMKVAQIILQRFGFVIDKAENGQEALNKVSNIDYDLVLMDCMMPVMDGFEATKRIRNIEKEDPKRKPLIIFALTANAGEDDKNKCLESGMNDFISKPIKKEVIQELIKRWF